MIKPRLSTLVLLLSFLIVPGLSAALEKGDPIPSISGNTLDGNHFELSSLKGRPVLIKLGTTWCGTCQEQEREINKLSNFLKENDIHYVDIFIQEGESKVRQYLSKDGLPKPDTIILDDGEISKQLNIYLIPRVILLDNEQRVYRDGDSISSSDLKQNLQELLDTI